MCAGLLSHCPTLHIWLFSLPLAARLYFFFPFNPLPQLFLAAVARCEFYFPFQRDGRLRGEEVTRLLSGKSGSSGVSARGLEAPSDNLESAATEHTLVFLFFCLSPWRRRLVFNDAHCGASFDGQYWEPFPCTHLTYTLPSFISDRLLEIL